MQSKVTVSDDGRENEVHGEVTHIPDGFHRAEGPTGGDRATTELVTHHGNDATTLAGSEH